MVNDVIIRAERLEKRFGDVEAVRGIDFEVRLGECLGLLGPNGAGKTTAMRMIMGLARPSRGALTVFGRPADALSRADRARIGLVPQDDTLDPDVTVAQNLEIYGRYFGVPRAELMERVPQLLAFMQLTEKRGAQVMQLSGGMKRRLILARALIGAPDLVILDEPTTGLDPQARVMIWKQLLALKRNERTLLLTTHYMDEAERLCDRIIIIDGGRILDEGTPKALIRRHVAGHVFEIPKPVPGAVRELCGGGRGNGTGDGRPGAGDGDGHADLKPMAHEDIGDAVLIYAETPAEVLDRLPPDGVFHHRPANLEDVFLRLTGRQLRDG